MLVNHSPKLMDLGELSFRRIFGLIKYSLTFDILDPAKSEAARQMGVFGLSYRLKRSGSLKAFLIIDDRRGNC